ncbi:hypothetical protein HRJ34_14890 [Rhizorhabdus wittichii]|uniref:Uncharacterized protein n=1 Tax=Rhizorhabdus wittichii TaxID=160791 RepID=A0A975D0X3_9SPHN|nr:hypothetical protein [Rhizorhabdus wittichii]QTH19660.1 hypothetical protein HRJ34_14890 [Rhizorhabdus wittichii]
MSKIASHAAVAPRLSATSVDFNALHAACLKGDDAAAAFAAANEADFRNRGEQAAEPEPGPVSDPSDPAVAGDA